MHPAVVAAIVMGGVIVLWGGYEFASRLYDEHEERQQYNEYVRRHHRDVEKSYLTDASTESSNDDDDDKKLWHREYENLRRRRHRAGSLSSSSRTKQSLRDENLYHSAYELTEMERSILDRRQRLQMEQAMLDKAERDLQRRREVLASRSGSGSDDDNDSNPFFKPPPPQEVPELPPRPQFNQELPSFFSSSPQQEREVIFESDSSSSSSEHASLYQSTGGLDASTTDLGPRIDALQAPSNLTSDADWSDVVGNRPRAQSDLSDDFSQLSVHSSKKSTSGESSVSYDMLSMTDLDDAHSQR